MKLRPLNKKGSYASLFVFMIVGFILLLCCGVFVFISTTTYDKLIENVDVFDKVLEDSPETGAGVINRTFGNVVTAYSVLKWATVLLIVGMILSILITSYLIRARPVFFVGYIFIVIIAIIVSAPMSNTYETIYNNPTLAPTFSGFFGATFIFLNLPIWVAVVGILAGIIMFAGMVKQSRYGGFV